MSKVTIGNTPMQIADNPWCSVDMCSSDKYYRRAPPWDSRNQGRDALSQAQKQAIEEFSQVARRGNEPRECKDKSGMQRNKCRVLAIGDEMRGKSFGGRSRSSRRSRTEGRRPRRRYREEE